MATRKSAQPSKPKAQPGRAAAKKAATKKTTSRRTTQADATLPKRKPGRPSKADIAARDAAEAKRQKAEARRQGGQASFVPPSKETGRPSRPRKPKHNATDPNVYPWYQGVLRQDFEGFEKGNRVYAQRENRPMFAGLAKVWRLISTVDGSHARLRVSEIQMGPNLTKLIRFERNEETNPPKVRSTRNNPDAHAKLDYTFSTLDAE